jgi:copper chaperone NosL
MTPGPASSEVGVPAGWSRRGVLRVLLGSPVALALVPLAGCSPSGPRPIRIGEEECAHCRMRISEARFAAQVTNARGRSWAFDSIECMVEWSQSEAEVPQADLAGLWVTNFDEPGDWIEASRAIYLHSEGLRSPMGVGLSAYRDSAGAEAQRRAHGGEVLNGSEVMAVVAGITVRGGQRHGS